MGETAYIAHACPCDSAAPPLQEERINPLDALGDSVSFGRFINESLTWDDKWSPFPQKRHVQEAEKYSQQGSVAQKKAFFEAHYKRIAAIKSATAAAALLQDQQPQMSNHKTLDLQTIMLTSDHSTQENPSDQCLSSLSNVKPVEIATPMDDEPLNQLNNTEKDHTVISSVTPHELKKPLEKVISRVTPHTMEKPLEKKPAEISVSSFRPVSKAPCSPTRSKAPPNSLEENVVTPIVIISQVETTDKLKQSPQSLRKLFSSSPIREPEVVNTPVPEVVEISRVTPGSSSDVIKDYTTSKPTKANPTEMQKHPLTTTLSETKRTKTSPSPCRTKTARSKWHIFLSLFSKSLRACRRKLCLSGSSSSRKGEMASRRKQKVTQTKFSDKEALELELQTKFKQVETEVKKLRKSLFSNSEKLPDVYNERENSKNKQIPQSPSYKLKD